MPSGLEITAGQLKAQDENWLTMFSRSLLGSSGSLIGLEPDADVQAWDQSHPAAAMAAALAPNLGYFGGALKLARIGALGKYGSWVDGLGAEWNPMLRYGTQEALRMVPFDAGRVALSSYYNGDTDSVAVDSVLNAGLSFGLGAGFGAFEAAGKPLLRKWGQVYDGSRLSPLQLQSRDLRRRLAEEVFDPETTKEAERQLASWRLNIIGEKPEKGGVLFKKLENGGSLNDLNRALFKTTGETPGQMPIRVPLKGTEKAGQFTSEKELNLVKQRLGLTGDDWHDYVQHPRIINPRTADAKRNLEATLNRNMSRVGSHEWIAKEEDGLYVVAKRTEDQEHYFSFKTDEPKRFLDDGGMLKKIEDYSAWLRQPTKEEAALIDSVDALKEANAFREAVPMAVLKDAPKAGGNVYLETSAKSIAQFLGYNPEFGGAKKVVGDFLHRYLSPAINQFTLPEARYSMSGANRLFDRGRGIVNERMVGAQELPKEGFLKAATKGGSVQEGSLVDLIQKLDDEDLVDLTNLLKKNHGVEEAQASGASSRLMNYLNRAQEIDTGDMDQLNAVQQIAGIPSAKRLRRMKNHLGLMRTYDGDYLIPIMEGKRTVGIAGGKNIGQAQAEAKRIVEAAAQRNRQWVAEFNKMITRGEGGDMIMFNRLSHEPEDMLILSEGRSKWDQPFAAKRMTTPRVKSIETGFVGSEKPLTKQQLIDNHMRIMTQNQRYIADTSWRYAFKDVNTTVAGLEPQVWHQMQQRINDHLGIKNEGDRFINKIIDPLLSPFIGKNSASRLVRGLNTIQMQLNFGAGNLAFPMMQLAQFTQTVMPELAFLQKGAPERLAQYYTNWAVGGSDLKPRTVVGMLDTWKMMGRGFKIMGNPAKALGAGADEYVLMMNGAMRRGTLNPGMIDEFIGDAARQKLTALERLKDTGNLWKTFSELSLFAPKAAERLSRLHAATVAFDFGKNVMGFEGRSLEQFIDEFTKRTMFGYSIADRPRIFTGPVGSAFGLFKNWQLNYLHMLSDYLGEGFGRNNWKPLLWSFTGAAAIGGIGAGGAIYGAADGMSSLLGNDSLMDLWYDNFQRDPNSGNWSDAIFLGLPAFLPTLVGLPGISFTSQAALPGSDPSRDISQLMNFVYWDRMKAIAQFGDALVSAQGNVFSDEQVQGAFLRAFAPKTVYRTQQILSEGVINSSNSLNPTQSGLTRTEQLLYALGFNPNNVELGFRAGDELWRDHEKNLQVVSSLGSSWADAELRGDWDSLDKIMKRAMLEGIDMDKVWRSARARVDNAQGDMFTRFPQEAVSRYQQSGVIR